VLQQQIEGIQARVRVLRTSSIAEVGRARAAVEELRGVVAAIAGRDARTATARYRVHITNAATTGLLHLREAAADLSA
jgi:DNA-binding GntR family transcriptional regulator